MGAEHISFLSRLRGRGDQRVERAPSPPVAPPPTPELSPDEALDDFLRRGSPGETFVFGDPEPEGPGDKYPRIKPYLPEGVFEEDW